MGARVARQAGRDARRRGAVYSVTPFAASLRADAVTPALDAPRAHATATATATPADAHGSAAVLRFRERVRARIGTAELLAFRVGAEHFAFDVRALDEAIEAPTIHAAPLSVGMAADGVPGSGAPAAPVLRGLAHVGERSIPVFDTARLLGVREGGVAAHVLVMRSGTRRIGLIADEVDDVITVDLAAIKPPPIDAGDELLLGVTWDGTVLTSILDARALITACQHRVGAGGT
jgi:chemotaxis signal transduction protein